MLSQAGMEAILARHARRYPVWQAADVYKLLHQGAMGSEHVLRDEASARWRLQRELAGLGPGPGEPLVDPISPDGAMVRVHLRPFMRREAERDLLLAAFLRTAESFGASPATLEERLSDAERLAAEGVLGVSAGEMQRIAAMMRKAGYPAVHHSAAFVTAYRPAYRVIAACFLEERWGGPGASCQVGDSRRRG